MLKGCKNGSGIDAPNHRKSMPKHVSRKIMEIITNHVFLKCTNMYIQCRNNGFEGFEGCVREQNKYLKTSQSETQLLPQINEKSMKINDRRNIQKILQFIKSASEKGSWNPWEFQLKQFWKPMQKLMQVNLSTRAGCPHDPEREDPLAWEAGGAVGPIYWYIRTAPADTSRAR